MKMGEERVNRRKGETLEHCAKYSEYKREEQGQ